MKFSVVMLMMMSSYLYGAGGNIVIPTTVGNIIIPGSEGKCSFF